MEQITGYIHIYIDLQTSLLQFGHDDHYFKPGESLLTFVQTDLSTGNLSFESLKNMHPYFRNARLTDTAIDHPHLQLLQSRYKELIDLYTHGLPWHDTSWLKQTACFSNIQITQQPSACIDYFISSFDEALFFEWLEILRQQIRIKTCKNCQSLFIPSKAGMEYCQQTRNSEGLTCSEIGYAKTFSDVYHNDVFLQAYTRAYKAHYARMTKPRKNRPNLTREEFEQWHQEAKQKLQEARTNQIAQDDFYQWLKK